MKLPKIVAELIKAQEHYDSTAYSNCFSETATVFDENKKYTGKAEIQKWIDSANKKYRTVMQPTGFEETRKESILTTIISGTFPGSPAELKYHFELGDGLIRSLKITG